MSLSSYKRAFVKRPSPTTHIIIRNLKRENAFLLKSLNELGRHHNDHNRITEKFLALVPLRPSPHDTDIEEYAGCIPEEPCSHEENHSNGSEVSPRRISCYTREISEIKDELVSISTRCQYLEDKPEKTRGKERSADVQDSDAIMTELKMKLEDAMVKNQQWVEYNHQRENYVKETLAKISWLEKHLQDTCNARTSDRSDFLLSEKKKIKQVEQYYEGLKRKDQEEVDILRERVCLTQQALNEAQRECRQKQNQLEELRKLFQKESDEQNLSQVADEGEYLTIGAEDLQDRLNRERRRSATLELQSGHLQKYYLNDYHKAQGQISKFKRVIEILLQDLHDERENCTYLKQQLELAQREERGTVKKAEDELQNPADPSDKPPLPPKLPHPRSPRKSLLDDSYMECPMCQVVYPASQYNELIEHLDHCQN